MLGDVMDETDFWLLIDDTRDASQGDPVEHADLLVERLVERTPDEVLDFARLFEARMARAWRTDLWGAADLLLGGAGEDAFEYFCAWLIGQGREVFEGALVDPDDLSVLLPDFDEDEDGDAEELGYAGDRAYEQLTGLHIPDLGRRTNDPLGAEFDFDDPRVMEQRFPRLWERYGG
ncbi:radical SAM superfamily enzyme YgiQ (UPF0313 family) [Streptacidiphilus sp. MAP12-20]